MTRCGFGYIIRSDFQLSESSGIKLVDEDIPIPIKSVIDQVINNLAFADARAAKLGVEDLLKYVLFVWKY
jgi:hypothetical protein